jgi:thioester reductase-like protein
VLTGVTGSLGAHVAASLAVLNNVVKIYCLVRANSIEMASSRTIQSMEERRVYASLPHIARQKIIAFPSDLTAPNLGLEKEVYDQIAYNITDLIHAAWSVNFRLQIGSFKDCISGMHNLLALCLKSYRSSPASFNFCSSGSTVTNTAGEFIPETLPASFSFAQNMGYAQSKLVAENICVLASEQTGICARVLRIGQISGDTKNGVWNTSEAIPLMLQSAVTIGALPALNEIHRWLPVDTVASAVVEITLAETLGTDIYNIFNHNSFHWTRDLLPLLTAVGLKFEEVSPMIWIERLKASSQDPEINPPILLEAFFAKKCDMEETAQTIVVRTEKARNLSPALQVAEGLNKEALGKMVKYFMARWNSA